MALFDPDRTQELLLVVGDTWRGANKKWLYLIIAAIIAAWPVHFVSSLISYNVLASQFRSPNVLGQVERAPLTEEERAIIKIGGDNYSGYVKIKNSNLEWGIPNLVYRIEVKSANGTVLASASSQSYILPASEKYFIVPRFSSGQTPTQIVFTRLAEKFVLKPDFPQINLEIQRNQTLAANDETQVSAIVRNTSAFTISTVDLMALTYNDKNEIVAINYTNINDLTSGELRSFRLTWPMAIAGSLRSEISTEINYFARDILRTQGPVSPFE